MTSVFVGPTVLKMMKNTGARTADVYAVQCEKCLKWRIIPSIHEFEEIRSKITEDPFVCNKRPDQSCDSPADIEYDTSRTWVMDKPNIPQTPSGFFREVTLRKDFSKMDVYYFTPEGKKLRSSVEVATFLEENPAYKEVVSLSDFSFLVPKVMPETVPSNVGKNKLRKRYSKMLERRV